MYHFFFLQSVWSKQCPTHGLCCLTRFQSFRFQIAFLLRRPHHRSCCSTSHSLFMKGHGGIYSVHMRWHFALELVPSVSSTFKRLMKQTILTTWQSLDPCRVNSERQTKIPSYALSLGVLVATSTSLWGLNRAWYFLFSLWLNGVS